MAISMPAPRLHPVESPQPRLRLRASRLATILVTATLLAVGYYPVHAHLQAIAVLLRIQSATAHGLFADRGIHPIRISESTFSSGDRSLRTRLYFPSDVSHAPAMIIVHGVHHLGYDEPRLVRFAKAMSGTGLIVSTPESPELASYEITPATIDEIAAAARDLSQRTSTPCVGVLGLSFAGGLALQAASDPETSQHICYVVAVGSHDDMPRVMKFLATDRAENPDGTTVPMPSHEYGALVAIYAHPEDFFPPSDLALAREAIRAQLFEEVAKARQIAGGLSPAGQATMHMLFSDDHAAAKAILRTQLEKHRAEMEAVSPAAELYRIHVPVLLLHGAGDNVVPPSETLWLAKHVPSQYLKAVLVSPAISHVELGAAATPTDKLKLVHFVEKMLSEAHNAPHNSIDLSHLAGAVVVPPPAVPQPK